MIIGISKEELIKLQSSIFVRRHDEFTHSQLRMLTVIIDHCKELQDPWMTLNEFLKSDFQGLCWMLTIYNDVVTVKFFDDKFILVNTGVCVPFKFITHVMPIHKPEMPKL